jgi:DNA-binding transcriptional LysR family regulator
VQVSVSTLPQLEKLSFTLQHMVIFRMVARTGSIKDAAMALGLSAGAVSKSIAALEQARTVRLVAVSLRHALLVAPLLLRCAGTASVLFSSRLAPRLLCDCVVVRGLDI